MLVFFLATERISFQHNLNSGCVRSCPRSRMLLILLPDYRSPLGKWGVEVRTRDPSIGVVSTQQGDHFGGDFLPKAGGTQGSQ